jgi:hypothetical protein
MPTVITKPREADITISGQRLTEAQSMTVRVALQAFAMTLQEGLGEDETGKRIADGYLRCIDEINQLIMRTAT